MEFKDFMALLHPILFLLILGLSILQVSLQGLARND